jgi:hypothetical protein
MTDVLSDATHPSHMTGARGLGRRMLEHFVAPAEPRVDDVSAPESRPAPGADADAAACATDLDPDPSVTPAEAWPAPWTAAGVDAPTDSPSTVDWLPPVALAGSSPTEAIGTVAGLARSPAPEPDDPTVATAERVRAARRRRAALSAGPDRVVVLGVPDDVTATAAAVANEVRGPRGVVLAVWSPRGGIELGEAPATFGARRLAGALAAEGHSATPRGRLAWAELPRDPRAAATAFDRLATTAPAPIVLAVAGPRPDAFETLLRRADLVVATIRPSDALLADLVRESLAGLTSSVVTVAPPVGPGRLFASAGFGRLPPIRDALRGRVPA